MAELLSCSAATARRRALVTLTCKAVAPDVDANPLRLLPEELGQTAGPFDTFVSGNKRENGKVSAKSTRLSQKNEIPNY